jgi:hypothetical protein
MVVLEVDRRGKFEAVGAVRGFCWLIVVKCSAMTPNSTARSAICGRDLNLQVAESLGKPKTLASRPCHTQNPTYAGVQNISYEHQN